MTDEDAFPDVFFAGEVFVEDKLEEKGGIQEKELEDRTSWRVQVEYSNHTTQDTVSYDDYLPDQVDELYLSLMEYFIRSL